MAVRSANSHNDRTFAEASSPNQAPACDQLDERGIGSLAIVLLCHTAAVLLYFSTAALDRYSRMKFIGPTLGGSGSQSAGLLKVSFGLGRFTLTQQDLSQALMRLGVSRVDSNRCP